MKHQSKLLLFFLLLTLSFVIVRADSLDDFINQQIKERKIPGLSLAIIRDGKVIRATGYGFSDLENRVSATPDTVYEIGSISKQFASEAVMLLVEDGKINLDDSINKYLPANAPVTWQKITVRNLLNHTSGLKDWTEVKEFSYRREYSAEEFIALVKDFPLLFEPNSTWSYSNTNLPLIGIIVEKAGGKSFEEFVNERIIKPLNFPSIRFKHQEEIVPNRSNGYVLRDNAWKNGEPFRPKVIAPSGGILATTVDLAKWWEANLNGRLLKQTSLAQMLMPVKLNDGRTVAHGFAFFIDTFNGHKVIQHFGSTVGGFGSIVRYYPSEKITIAIIGNLEDDGFGAEYIAKRVANFYIPGSFISGLKETANPNPQETEKLLQLLRDIAATKNSDLLVPSYAGRINPAFREKIAENLKTMKTFNFLGSEKVGSEHFMLDSFVEYRYFKMTTKDRIVYYHFRFMKAGNIGLIIAEE